MEESVWIWLALHRHRSEVFLMEKCFPTETFLVLNLACYKVYQVSLTVSLLFFFCASVVHDMHV